MSLVLGCATPAPAQILGGGLGGLPGVGGLPGGLPPSLGSAVGSSRAALDDLAAAPLDQVRRLTAGRLLSDHPDLVEADDRGRPVVRGELLAIDLSPQAADRLREAGFAIRRRADLDGLGIATAVVALPKGLSAVEGVRRLRALDPAGRYDFNHLYQESGPLGATAATAGPGGPDLAGSAQGRRIGLVDGSVAASRPALSGAHLIQRAFAPGGARASAHATAAASLIISASPAVRGVAPGATLYVADVYGPTPAGGSADAVARGLAWMAQSRAAVINISLVGPPNLLLEAAVRGLIARGHLVVAAVGNDGPAAPPLYPAAYQGVIAVTAVDARHRVLPEAGRGTHVDFAARGSEVMAAGLDGGLVKVRGTSFAAPIVAGELARLMGDPAPAAAARAVETLGRTASDLGAPGPDPIYGRGEVGREK